jgi:hypothetical protein
VNLPSSQSPSCSLQGERALKTRNDTLQAIAKIIRGQRKQNGY